MSDGLFGLQLAAFAARAGENAAAVVRKVSIDVLASVILKSPVDTGRFRANWQVGEAAVGKQLATVDPSGTAAIAAGSTTIVATPLGAPILITNSLPYAERLEYGYSRQAPQGMVRITVAEFQQFVDKAARAPAVE